MCHTDEVIAVTRKLNALDARVQAVADQYHEVMEYMQGIDTPEARCMVALAKEVDSELGYNRTMYAVAPVWHRIIFGEQVGP